MRFINLIISNIGPYRGTQELSFGSSSERSIDIVIGSNGSGKTYLLRAILWALGLYKPLNDRWIHRGCVAAGVELKFEINNQIVEITRTVTKDNLTHHDALSSSERLFNGSGFEPVYEPESFLSAHFPGVSGSLFLNLLAYDSEYLARDECSYTSKIPAFSSWAVERIPSIVIPHLDSRRNTQVISVVLELLGGPPAYAAAGERSLGTMLLQSLFREWIVVTEKLPDDLKKLSGQFFPLFLDCPFMALDEYHIIAAIEIVSRFAGPVLICTNVSVGNSAANLLASRLGSLSVIRVGHDLWHGWEIKIFDRVLNLTRDDNTDFSEIVSY